MGLISVIAFYNCGFLFKENELEDPSTSQNPLDDEDIAEQLIIQKIMEMSLTAGHAAEEQKSEASSMTQNLLDSEDIEEQHMIQHLLDMNFTRKQTPKVQQSQEMGTTAAAGVTICPAARKQHDVNEVR